MFSALTHFFCRIDGQALAVLYSQELSRPNVRVNVLVGLEALKSDFGWSDEELYEQCLYNLQVRYALGYSRLGEGEFKLRTLYNFRQRLSRYPLTHGVNLLEQAFEAITDQQRVALQVRSEAQLQAVGQALYVLLQAPAPNHAAEAAFQVVQRLFTENFHVHEQQARAKENHELSSGCLQSLDDPEASDHTKGTAHSKGYVVNLTETCDPQNALQLITKVQVAPNNTSDAQLLNEALPNLKERTELDTLVTDGAYASAQNVEAFLFFVRAWRRFLGAFRISLCVHFAG
ncbi:MAG: transposase [Anaerolineales bacterium]|nr:transposase [Anaerolineales bacterium]